MTRKRPVRVQYRSNHHRPNYEVHVSNNVTFLKDFIYLFLERGEGRERNINVWLPLIWPPLGTWPWGPGLQPRHVP